MTEANPPKKLSLTPKAIIHQKFGDKASYKVEEVKAPIENGCPGLAIPQKAQPCLYRCTLQLPEATIISGTFKKKKDAEQSAAEKAIEKLGIHLKEYNPTVQEAWDDLTHRIAYLFANEFLSSTHPLRGHFKAAWGREGHFNGYVPVSVIAAYDPKICNICKYIYPRAEANSLLVMSSILKAASTLTDLLTSDEQLSIKRMNPYPSEIISSIDHSSLPESFLVDLVRIPVSRDKTVESLTLNIGASGYYLDEIALALGSTGASNVLISRTIGKASSEMRIYYAAPKKDILDKLLDPQVSQATPFEKPQNIRASYLAGQEIYGDAVMATVGYTWKTSEFFHEAVSLSSYYRFLVDKIPTGAYMISRDAILAAKLPSTYTTKNNWRGSFPRDILCAFCRSHHLSEPVFSTQSIPPNSSLDAPGSRKKLKCMQLSEEEKGKAVPSLELFSCEVKIYTKNHDLVLHCSPQESHRKQADALQSIALKVLSWLDIFFKKPHISLEQLTLLAKKHGIHFTPNVFKEFALCHRVHSINADEVELSFIDIRGQNSEIIPSNGSLACISYTASLFSEEECFKETLESCEAFEFEMGNEGVWPHLEAAVAQMSAGQSAYFTVELPLSEFILAALAGSSAETPSLSSSRSCKLEYCVTLFQVMEPMEERMEQAQFSPPLSKQRVEFAVQRIKESSAASLIDFGCGSGSLLDSLLSYPTSLEKIVGVDISQRALAKAAKSLHSKLNKLSDSNEPSTKMKSAVLYDGSITNFDSRLCDFDIATCIEVIEHMEEEDACLFGDIVLSSFAPKILVISTPNYEYNVILQGCIPPSQEDDPDEKYQAQACKFRNHDHKFEWTRSQFESWASDLASRHNYSVEFSGVGGAGDVEPGFASQIAIFRRGKDGNSSNIEFVDTQYALIWEWSGKDK